MGAAPAELPARVRRIVLHTLGGPSFAQPESRFVFQDPPRTRALWSRRFGAHWIVWTDGSIWPRYGEPFVPWGLEALGARLAAQAAPVYSHLHNGNSRTVGIEVAHGGRSAEPFPPAQAAAAAWLVRSLLVLSRGRLGPEDVYGHKDLDQRPAYVRARCARRGCPVFVDERGVPFRRRVDPPEGLFRALAREGLVIPRPGRDDTELRRAEALRPGERPRTSP